MGKHHESKFPHFHTVWYVLPFPSLLQNEIKMGRAVATSTKMFLESPNSWIIALELKRRNMILFDKIMILFLVTIIVGFCKSDKKENKAALEDWTVKNSISSSLNYFFKGVVSKFLRHYGRLKNYSAKITEFYCHSRFYV